MNNDESGRENQEKTLYPQGEREVREWGEEAENTISKSLPFLYWEFKMKIDWETRQKWPTSESIASGVKMV